MLHLLQAGGFDLIQRDAVDAYSNVLSTSSPKRTAARALGYALFSHVLNGTHALNVTYSSDDPQYNRNEEDPTVIRTNVFVDLFRHFFNLTDKGMWASLGNRSQDDVKALGGLLIPSQFFPEGWHRAHQYIFASAFKQTRRRVGTKLVEVLGENVKSVFGRMGLSDDEKYMSSWLVSSLTSSAPVAMHAFDIINFIRKDPCGRVPLWDQDPEKFVLESLRLQVGANMMADTGEGHMNLHFRPGAHLDESVFIDPFKFDPTRDLSDGLMFNAREGDVNNPDATTTKRICPGRKFGIRSLIAHVEAHMPRDVECAYSNRKFHDVCFKATIKPYQEDKTLEVFEAQPNCKEPRFRPSRRTLFLYLPESEQPPQVGGLDSNQLSCAADIRHSTDDQKG